MELAALLNAEASRVAGHPVSVVTLADVAGMGFEEYAAWRAYLSNLLQRRKVEAKG